MLIHDMNKITYTYSQNQAQSSLPSMNVHEFTALAQSSCILLKVIVLLNHYYGCEC